MNRSLRKRLTQGLLALIVLWLFFAILPITESLVRWKTYVWFPTYVVQWALGNMPAEPEDDFDLFLFVTDHYEPGMGPQSSVRNRDWLNGYRKLADRHRDHENRVLQHTLFYPLEQFNDLIMTDLEAIPKAGYGEIEVHWHHHQDTPASFTQKLCDGLSRFARHGALMRTDGTLSFGFIHGDWGLDNSLGPKRCGVSNELALLASQGCYADFTFPAFGTTAQPRKTNAIYYAADTPDSKSYDCGPDVAVGRPASGTLMIFEGPMRFCYRGLRLSPFYLEYGAIENTIEGSSARADFWMRASIPAKGREDWRFLKLFTHGQQSGKTFFGSGFEEALAYLEGEDKRGRCRLHFVTAREAYNLAKAAEAGKTGNPTEYYDWLIKPPLNRRSDWNDSSMR